MSENIRPESILHLVLKGIWYDKIESGEKTSEYRDNKAYWTKRISGKKYVVFHRGYTNKKIMMFEIMGISWGSPKIEIVLGKRLS